MMNLPKPSFNANATPLEIKRYLVQLVEEIERQAADKEEDDG